MDTPFPLGLERFQFRSRLGQGGMGVVWRVWDNDLGHDVALKTLATVDADAVYRLKREFRSLAQLSHPNLINLYELFCEQDVWFFTMELVQGVSFTSWVSGQSRAQDEATRAGSKATDAAAGAPDPVSTEDSTHRGAKVRSEEPTHHRAEGAGSEEPTRRRPDAADAPFAAQPRARGFVPERLFDALRQLALGVQALHDAGKEHRDLKPANVMVTSHGRVVLLDFGLAFDRGGREFYEDDTERNSSSGTPAYMAPERHLGEAASFAGDWYSVGVMLYEALTGQKPFSRLSDVLGAKPPVAPSELIADVPEALSQLALDLLRRKADERPTGPEILARIGGTAAPPRPSAPALAARTKETLVGRHEHLARLQAAYSKLALGRTVQVRVQGPSGYGKSALVRHFLEGLLAKDAAIVLAGRCYERESVPYKVFDSVIDALTRYLTTLAVAEARSILPPDIRVLTRLFPPLLRVPAVADAPQLEVEVKDVHELSRRASAALWGIFQRVAMKKPLVLYVDDLQWGDADSARLLAELLAPPSPPPLMLLVSYRSEDLKSPVLQQLLDATEAAKELITTDTLEVGPLSNAEAGDLARLVLGAKTQATERVLQEAAGSPFFVQQLAQYVASSADALAGSAQLTLSDVLRARLKQLPDVSRELLTVVSVAGRPISRQLAVRAMKQSEGVDEALNGLRSGNWVRMSGPKLTDTIEPYHDKIRETTAADLAAEETKGIHRRFAGLLEADGALDPEALTAHWLGAGDAQRAGKYAVIAAEHAVATLAFDRAADLYKVALGTVDAAAPERKGLLIALAHALKNAGRGPEAAQVYLDAAALTTDEGERLELQRGAFERYLVSGYLEQGRTLAQSVLKSVGLSMPEGRVGVIASLLFQRARANLRGRKFKERAAADIPRHELSRIDVCWSMAVGLTMIDTKLGSDFNTRYVRYALDGGEPDRISRALAFEAAHHATTANFAKAEQLVVEADALAQRCGSEHAKAFVLTNRGFVEYFQGRYPSAVDAFDAATHKLRERCTGVSWEVSTSQMMANWTLVYLGRWDELLKRAPQQVAEGKATGDLYRMDSMAISAGVVNRLTTDEPERARSEMKENAERWTPSGFQVQHFFRLLMMGWVDLYAGEPDRYWPELLKQWPALKGSLLLTVDDVRYRMHFIRGFAALALPDSKDMRAEAKRCAAVVSKTIAHGAGGVSALLRAALAAREGQPEVAVGQLSAAIASYEQAGMGLFSAAAQWRLGQLKGGDEGGALITKARAFMETKAIKKPERVLGLFAPGFG